MLRQATDAKARHDQPPHFPHARRRANHRLGQAHLIAKERKHRERITDLVAGERDKLLTRQIGNLYIGVAEERVILPTEQGVALAQEQPVLDLLGQRPFW